MAGRKDCARGKMRREKEHEETGKEKKNAEKEETKKKGK